MDAATTTVPEGNLSEMRLEIQAALGNFHEHIKYTMTVMSTIVILAVGLLAFGVDHNEHKAALQLLPSLNVLMLISAGAFLLLVPASWVAEKICRRYYLIYASNYIYYARCHIQYAKTDHPWVQDLFLKQNLTKETLYSDHATEDFLCGRGSTDRNSWVYYRYIIQFYGWIGGAGALYLFVKGVGVHAVGG